ncbi:ATP-dependent zinc metalloprotease YME1L isoform X4, partial [Ixodes scapularis]
FSKDQLRTGAPLLSCLFLSAHSSNLFSPLMRPLQVHQVRGFKTKSPRTMDSASALSLKAPDLNERFLALRTRKDKDKQKVYTEVEQNEKLKSLLTDENLTSEEQQRLRVAFAEGYLASDPKTRPNTKLRIFNIFRDLLGIILILAILFSFM